MAGPGYKDLPVYHGDTLTFSVVIAEVVDMTGHTPLFQVRNAAGALIADWSEFVTIATPQRLDIVVPGQPDADGTTKLPRPRGTQTLDYDLQLTAPITGTVRTILRGKVIVTGDVSHG
jgi:hypothetical protein